MGVLGWHSKAGVAGEDRRRYIAAFAEHLWSRRNTVLEVLCDVDTYRFAIDEIVRSLRALHGAAEEVERHRPKGIKKLAVYAPSNVLLYSYVLYCVIPLLYTDEVVVRPSSRVRSVHRELHELLGGSLGFPIHYCEMTQREFWDLEASGADAVVFTGTYRNGCEVAEKASPSQLFLYFGSGVNPVVVGPEADLSEAVQDTVEMRTLNSGQDCICPDVIFVVEDRLEAFLRQLKVLLDGLYIGERSDPSTIVAPIYYKDAVESVAHYVQEHRSLVVYGGDIDPERSWIPPTILVSEIRSMPPVLEFFSPIFNVVAYRSDDEILERLSQPEFTHHGMGVSVYGAPWLAGPLARWHTVAVDQRFLDLENGNRPFGGYGEGANFVAYRGRRVARPLLISRELGLVARGAWE